MPKLAPYMDDLMDAQEEVLLASLEVLRFTS